MVEISDTKQTDKQTNKTYNSAYINMKRLNSTIDTSDVDEW